MRTALARRNRTTRTIAASVGTLLVAGSVFGVALGANADETAPASASASASRAWVEPSAHGTYTPWIEQSRQRVGIEDGQHRLYVEAFDMEAIPFDPSLGKHFYTEHVFDVHGPVTATIVNNSSEPIDAANRFYSAGLFSLQEEDFHPGVGGFHDYRSVTIEQPIDLRLGVGESMQFDVLMDTRVEDDSPAQSTFDLWTDDTPTPLGVQGVVLGNSDWPRGVDVTWHAELTIDVGYRHLYLPWVTPVAPTLSGCGEEQTVTIPAVDGLVYSDPAREGDLVTVTAEALEGWAIRDTESSTWTFTLDPAAECETATPVNYNLSVSHNEAIATVDTVLVNVHALDENGEPESDLGDVHVQSTFGEISSVEMIEPGLFQATLISHAAGEATVTFTVDDVDGEQSEQVTFIAASTTGPTTGTTGPATGGGLPATGSTFPVLPVTLGALGLALLGGLAFAFRRQTPEN